jgi:hypothetical protein
MHAAVGVIFLNVENLCFHLGNLLFGICEAFEIVHFIVW